MDRIRIRLSECYAHDGNNLINIMTMKSGPRETRTSKNGVQQIDDNLKFTLSNNNLKSVATSLETYIHYEGACPLQFSHFSAYALEAEGNFVDSIVSFDSHIVILNYLKQAIRKPTLLLFSFMIHH
jgi:hypothetical protein